MAVAARVDTRPYIIRMYDRWIILAIVLLAAWFARPLFAFVLYYRGVTFEHMLVLSTAEHYYKKSVKVYDRIPEGWIGLGELYMMRAPAGKGPYALTIKTLDAGTKLNPKSFRLTWDLGRAYLVYGHEYAKSLSVFQRALALKPKDRSTLDFAAWSAWHLGDRQRAFAYWHQLLALYPHDEPVQAILKRLGG